MRTASAALLLLFAGPCLCVWPFGSPTSSASTAPRPPQPMASTAPPRRPRLPLDKLLHRYMKQHGRAALDAESNAVFSQRKFVVGVYGCPEQLGNMMQGFLNAFAFAVISNRTLVHAPCIDHKVCRFTKVSKPNACDAYYPRRPWLPAANAVLPRLVATIGNESASVEDLPRECIEAGFATWCCPLDALPARAYTFASVQLGHVAKPVMAHVARPGVRLRPDAASRAAVLFRSGGVLVGYGALFATAFTPSEALAARVAAILQAEHALAPSPPPHQVAQPSPPRLLGLHLRHFHSEDNGSVIPPAVEACVARHEAVRVALFATDRPAAVDPASAMAQRLGLRLVRSAVGAMAAPAPQPGRTQHATKRRKGDEHGPWASAAADDFELLSQANVAMLGLRKSSFALLAASRAAYRAHGNGNAEAANGFRYYSYDVNCRPLGRDDIPKSSITLTTAAACPAASSLTPALAFPPKKLPPCTHNRHRDGQWRHLGELANGATRLRTKSFTCCSWARDSAATRSTNAGNASALCSAQEPMIKRGAGYGGPSLLQTRVDFGGHACACDDAHGTHAARRPSERWGWEPSACRLPPWHPQRFCATLGARRLLLVGDSTMEQFASTLMALLRREPCVAQLGFERDETLIGRCLGNQNSNTEGWMHLVRSAEPPPDIVLLNAGAHVYASQDLAHPLECATKCSRACKKPRVNASVHAATIERVVSEVVAQIRHEQRASTPPRRLAHTRFVWRSMAAAHAGCTPAGDALGPRASPAAATTLPYQWHHFPLQDAVTERVASQSGGALSFLDVSMLYSRPDSHARDCLHYCAPGPLDEGARVLLGMLQQGELG